MFEKHIYKPALTELKHSVSRQKGGISHNEIKQIF